MDVETLPLNLDEVPNNKTFLPCWVTQFGYDSLLACTTFQSSKSSPIILVNTVAGQGAPAMSAKTLPSTPTSNSSQQASISLCRGENNDIYVLCHTWNKLLKWSTGTHELVDFAGTGEGGYFDTLINAYTGDYKNSKFNGPSWMSYNSRNKAIYVCDTLNTCIRILPTTATLSPHLAWTTNIIATCHPVSALGVGLTADQPLEVFVAPKTVPHLPSQFVGASSPSRIITIGSRLPGASRDGSAGASAINKPTWIEFQSSDSSWNPDIGIFTEPHKVRAISPYNGDVWTIAGSDTTSELCQDGPTKLATLGSDLVGCIDPYGDIFIMEKQEGKIRRVNQFYVTTVAGGGRQFTDGVPARTLAHLASFNLPSSMCLWFDPASSRNINFALRGLPWAETASSQDAGLGQPSRTSSKTIPKVPIVPAYIPTQYSTTITTDLMICEQGSSTIRKLRGVSFERNFVIIFDHFQQTLIDINDASYTLLEESKRATNASSGSHLSHRASRIFMDVDKQSIICQLSSSPASFHLILFLLPRFKDVIEDAYSIMLTQWGQHQEQSDVQKLQLLRLELLNSVVSRHFNTDLSDSTDLTLCYINCVFTLKYVVGNTYEIVDAIWHALQSILSKMAVSELTTLLSSIADFFPPQRNLSHTAALLTTARWLVEHLKRFCPLPLHKSLDPVPDKPIEISHDSAPPSTSASTEPNFYVFDSPFESFDDITIPSESDPEPPPPASKPDIELTDPFESFISSVITTIKSNCKCDHNTESLIELINQLLSDVPTGEKKNTISAPVNIKRNIPSTSYTVARIPRKGTFFTIGLTRVQLAPWTSSSLSNSPSSSYLSEIALSRPSSPSSLVIPSTSSSVDSQQSILKTDQSYTVQIGAHRFSKVGRMVFSRLISLYYSTIGSKYLPSYSLSAPSGPISNELSYASAEVLSIQEKVEPSWSALESCDESIVLLGPTEQLTFRTNFILFHSDSASSVPVHDWVMVARWGEFFGAVLKHPTANSLRRWDFPSYYFKNQEALKAFVYYLYTGNPSWWTSDPSSAHILHAARINLRLVDPAIRSPYKQFTELVSIISYYGDEESIKLLRPERSSTNLTSSARSRSPGVMRMFNFKS